MYHKLANHDRLDYYLKRAITQNKALKAELAAFEAAEPPGGKAGARSAAGTGKSYTDEANSEIDSLDKG